MPARLPSPARGSRRRGSRISALDDLDEPPPVARPQPRPAARAAAPMPALRSPRAARSGSTLSLQLEIEGLSGELRRALEALLGKVIELPPLRIRVKTDDL